MIVFGGYFVTIAGLHFSFCRFVVYSLSMGFNSSGVFLLKCFLLLEIG